MSLWTTMSRKSRSFTSKFTAVLLTFSLLINIYLLFNAPVKSVRIKNVVNLNDKNSDFLNHKAEDSDDFGVNAGDVGFNEIVNLNVDRKELDFGIKEEKIHKEVNKPEDDEAEIAKKENAVVVVIDDKKDTKNENVNTKDVICSQFSSWTNHLIIPKTPTNLKDWSFGKKIECPKFTVDKHPTVRQKIALQCNGPYSKLVTSTTTSYRDITSVEFGNICLSEVIDNCCLGKQAVPNVVHYIWYADKELGYFQFISFMSALRFMKPCLFLIHGKYIPRGKYWDYFVSISPNIIHVVREKPEIVFGQKLAYEEHASDVMRIEALKLYGGVYLDFDEILLRPLEPLRKYDYTQGHERDVTMGSQLVMAKKNATFLNHWYHSYRDNYKKDWAWNALWVPDKLSKKYPELIHVEGYNFTRPNWQHTELIFRMNYDWSTNYGMHMYVRWYKNETNNVIIRTLNTTIGAVARHVLFGNKELCIS